MVRDEDDRPSLRRRPNLLFEPALIGCRARKLEAIGVEEDEFYSFVNEAVVERSVHSEVDLLTARDRVVIADRHEQRTSQVRERFVCPGVLLQKTEIREIAHVRDELHVLP